MTISELLEHKYKLEYEVLDIDEGELVLRCIKTGCVELTWQIPRELVYRAYTSMKRKHDELSSLSVESLVCKVADEFAGLPILWRGQEVGEVGPIEPLPEHVRQEPYSLQQGFHWVTLSSNNIDKVAKFFSRHMHDNKMINLTHERIIEFCLGYPNTDSKWFFGVQTTDGKLVAVVLAIPFNVCIGRETRFVIGAIVECHKKYKNNRLRYMLIKELVRRSNLSQINQLILYSISISKPVTTVTRWLCDLRSKLQLPSSPRTPGWRRMTSGDVPSALALINKWSSQFEIRAVLNSKEEFSYNFLHQKWIISYVVEDKAYNITDFISFSLLNMPHFTDAFVKIVVSTQSPVKQLLIDTLVCAKENGAELVSVSQRNIETNILASLSFQPFTRSEIHLYNYRYQEISQARVWFFHL